MISIRNVPIYWVVFVAASSGLACRFDTTPVLGPLAGASVATHDAPSLGDPPDASDVSTGATQPLAAGAPAPSSAQRWTAAPTGVDAGVLAPQPTPAAASGGMRAPAPPADPVHVPAVEPAHCAGSGSYGLRLTADLSWDSGNGLTLAGRGPAEIYAKLDLQELAAVGGKIRATARVCGIVLPPSTSPLSCGPRQLRFASDLWEQRAVPPWSVTAQYTCAADVCSLELGSSSYDLGISATTPSQFPDDDADGSPGVNVDIAIPASDPANPSCGAWLGWGASAPSQSAGSLRIGVHTQLQVALRLADDCSVANAAGAVEAFELHAADCAPSTSAWGSGVTQASDAGSAGASCAPEQRAALDESLPRYRALIPNEVPAVARDSAPSAGTEVRAVRLIAGGAATCEQVREAMY